MISSSGGVSEARMPRPRRGRMAESSLAAAISSICMAALYHRSTARGIVLPAAGQLGAEPRDLGLCLLARGALGIRGGLRLLALDALCIRIGLRLLACGALGL